MKKRLKLPLIFTALCATFVISASATEISPSSATASSTLSPWGSKTYDAYCAIDGDITTAWVEDASGLGIGEWIELQFSQTELVQEIQFYNGYGNAFDTNGVLTQVTITLSGGENYSYDVDGYWNTIELPTPVETSSVRLTIESAYSNGDEDTCISEILVYGTSNVNTTTTTITLSTEELLSSLPYNGDISQINMSNIQAEAFAAVIEQGFFNIWNDSYTPYTYVALFDAGNGIPGLWAGMEYLGVADSSIWMWNGVEAVPLDVGVDGDEHIVITTEGTTYFAGTSGGGGVDPVLFDGYYRFTNGIVNTVPYFWHLEFLYTYTMNFTENWDNYFMDCMETWDGFGGMKQSLSDIGLPTQENILYPYGDSIDGYIYLENGAFAVEDATSYTDIVGNVLYELQYAVVGSDRWWNPSGNWADATSVAATLTSYAQSASSPTYSYPALSSTAFLSDILDQLAAQFGGEIVGAYDLGDGVYYIIIDVSDGQSGALVQAYKVDGVVNYAVSDTHDSALSQSELQTVVTMLSSTANVDLDFTQVNKLTSSTQFVNYLQSVLDNMSGTSVNDSAKSDLATFIENAIATESTTAVTASNNVVTITPDSLTDSLSTASSALTTYESLLSDQDITLNKGITLIIRIIGSQMDTGEPMEVMLDATLLDVIGSETLQIFLGSSSYAIEISADNLKLLIGEYGAISVQIQCANDGTYTVNFLDTDREIIDTLVAPITITLPCDHEFYTVMARYGTEMDNWGGQYSAIDGTISFTTPYTGIYELLDNSQNIADISDLPEETQDAITFMISKGFFTTDEDENFRPEESLSRQDATKALVSMFFTLDRTLTCDFPDVAIDSYYYSYIASAFADGIVEGYDDGTFGGEDTITTEQLLTIIARTLADKKGYLYPEDATAYLTISGSEQTSDWAQETVALAIREGIVLAGETIDPTAPVTREAAALYLYRLFMLLEEVRPVAIEMDFTAVAEETHAEETDAQATEEGESTTALPIVAIAGVVVLVAAGATTAIFLPKHLKKAKGTKDT